MIRITLYKNCILNDKYQNVFCMERSPNLLPSAFEGYLTSLTKKTYDIDYIYQDDMTSLNFKIDSSDYGNIYDYNYLKIQSINDDQIVLTRYAFINSIKIGNEIAVVSYKIDIWHSYIQKVQGMNFGILKGLRITDGYGTMINPSYKKLPVQYEGNDYLKPTGISPHTYLSDNCGMIIQIQIYTTESFGNSTAATTQYFFINNYKIHKKIDDAWVIENHSLTIESFETELERIINLSGGQNFNSTETGSSTDYYFKIGRVFIVPYNFYTYFEANGNKIEIKTKPSNITKYWEYTILSVKTSSMNLAIYNTHTISNNYKMKAIGFPSLYFPIETNGTDFVIKEYVSFGKSEFNYFISCQNKFIDITKLFEFYPVITQMSGDVLAQQKISRAINNLEDVGNALKRAANLTSTLVSGQSQYVTAENRASYSNIGLLSDYYNKDVASSGIIGGIAGFFVDSVNAGLERSARNAPIYNSTGMVKANNTALVNFIYGLSYFTLTADNEKYVKDTINNIGYDVYEFINDYSKLYINNYGGDLVSHNAYYNCIRLENADLYGSFPLEIAKCLNKILERGIKIWYDSDISYALSHDTYVVG